MRQFFILATLAVCFSFASISYGTPIGPASQSSDVLFAAALSQNSSREQPPLTTFTGTIAKNGDEFVLNESKTHKLYELDDQNTAAKFVEKSVTITGTFDVVKNIIRIQSIAEVAA
jgi:hypothetical protein